MNKLKRLEKLEEAMAPKKMTDCGLYRAVKEHFPDFEGTTWEGMNLLLAIGYDEDFDGTPEEAEKLCEYRKQEDTYVSPMVENG